MIYVQNTSEAQAIVIPNNGLHEPGPAVLTIRSTVEKRDILTQSAEMLVADTLYYYIDIMLPQGTKKGEYDYILAQSDVVLSKGLLIVGDYEGAAVQTGGEIEILQGK